MKRSIMTAVLLLGLVAILALVGCTAAKPATSGSTPATPATGTTGGSTTVTIKNFAFDPASVTVKVGDSVTFKNEDSTAHTVTGTNFDSGQIAPSASYSQKFDTAGTFDYHCSIHPSMTGTVIVQ